jgi:uncharacterized Fe-S cluster protein YjdI
MGQKAYEAEDIIIRFDPRRCIHAAECVHGLPAVFDADRRPWITPDAASASEIVTVVQQCPSGALTYERRDGGPAEVVAPEPSVTTLRNGPLHLRGRCTVTDHDGAQIDIGPRATLCRCGASSNKPFCDNSHIEAGFRDDR